MKHLLLCFLAILPQLASAELASKYGDCSSDLACVMGKEAKLKEQKEEAREENIQSFQNQQLQLQRQELDQVQTQNKLLEDQLEQEKNREIPKTNSDDSETDPSGKEIVN